MLAGEFAVLGKMIKTAYITVYVARGAENGLTTPSRPKIHTSTIV
jgi:hypothetical protein